MVIHKSKNFGYWYTGNNIVMFKKKDELREDLGNITTIASNTSNTWQANRGKQEILSNTLQGKIAEDMFSDFIHFTQPNKNIAYLSYDKFRNDNFNKHAPIDGLLYQRKNEKLDICVKQILKDVSKSEYGKIDVNTRRLLKTSNIYTVEVKSSRIPEKDYEIIDPKRFKSRSQQNKLLEALRNRDYFTYPEFTRTLGKTVHNFDRYCEYVRESRPEYSKVSDSELKSAILTYEVERKCDIYTRIFMDFKSSDSVIGYLTGYALGKDFFDHPTIINMSRENKSENALYYVFPIEECNAMIEIFNDQRLW